MLEIPKVNAIYKSIVNRTNTTTLWKITLVVIANGKRIAVRNVLSRDTLCDFEVKVTDEDFIFTQIGKTTFKNYILPFKDDLKAEVTYTLLSANGLEVVGHKKAVEVYRAFIIDPPNLDISRKTTRNDNEQLDELAGLLPIHFQLLPLKLIEMRLVDVMGVYKGNTVSDILTTVLAYDLGDTKSKTALLKDSYAGIRGVNIVPPHNTKTYKNLIIPVGTKLTTIAKFLQKECGIYTTGVNRYFKYGYWFVYPLYDPKRYAVTKKRATIVNMPQDELMSPESSFKVEGNEVFILTSGEASIKDDTESISQNAGNAIRYSKSECLIDGMNSTSKNKSKTNFSDTQVAISAEAKPNGMDNARYSENVITDNPFAEMSVIAKGLVSLVKVNWANSRPEHIYPGMPVKFLYEKSGTLKEVYGSVLGMRTTQAPSSGKLQDNTYFTNTTLILAIQKIKG